MSTLTLLVLCNASHVQLVLGLFSVCLSCNVCDAQEVERKKYWNKSRLCQFFCQVPFWSMHWLLLLFTFIQAFVYM